MSDWRLPWDGGCLCGQVRFQITAAPLLTVACHCVGCQKLTASAYSLSIIMPAEGLRILQGETVLGGLHGPHRQEYCPHCKGWMFTRPQGLEAFVNVRASLLDDHRWYVPFVEVFTSEKLPWAHTPARHSFETQPDLEGFQPLLQAFTQDGVRPA